jgi:hypothetical protein
VKKKNQRGCGIIKIVSVYGHGAQVVVSPDGQFPGQYRLPLLKRCRGCETPHQIFNGTGSSRSSQRALKLPERTASSNAVELGATFISIVAL